MPEPSVLMYSIEAEQQLLGMVMVDNRAYFRCSDILKAECFYDPVHARMWGHIATRINGGGMISPVVMATLMANDDGLSQLGGAGYLARVAGASISSAGARDYASMIVEAWQRRCVSTALSEALEGIQEGAPPSTALEAILSVSEVMQTNAGKPSSVSFLGALAEAVKALTADEEVDSGGVLSGIKEWDKLIGRLRRGDMLVLGGRPSMGKTSLALALGEAVADQRRGVAIVSLEMTGESLAARSMGAASGVQYQGILDRTLDEESMRKVIEAAHGLQHRSIEIVQPHIKDLHAINAALMRIKNKFEASGKRLDLVIIDYLQLVRAPGKDTLERVSNASNGIKALAMQLDIPVIALAQLSRGVEGRENKRPILSDLRDSGAIEQDADIVVFCYRDEYYIERDMKPDKDDMGALADWTDALSRARNKMELICAKKRNGRIGTATVYCDVATNRIGGQYDDRGPEVAF